MTRPHWLPLLGERIGACPGSSPGLRGHPGNHPRVTHLCWGVPLFTLSKGRGRFGRLRPKPVRVFRATAPPVTQRSLERVAPAQTGEAAEVAVVGVDFGLVFHGQRGDVGVGDQVASNAGGLKGAAHQGQVLPAGVQGRDMG